MTTVILRIINICVLTLIIAVYISAADTVTVVLQVDKDVFICDCEPNTTNPGGPLTKLFQGPYYTGGHTCYARSLMRWDISGLPQNITIASAIIELKCTNTYGTLTGQMAFSRNTQDWSETSVSHNTAPLYSAVGSITRNWPAAGQWFSVDALEFINFWYAHSDSNLGITAHSINTTGGITGIIGYYSSRYTTDTTQCPRLTLKYTQNPTSIKSEGANIPGQFHLETFPNPFNPTTHIKFDIAKSGLATLRVFDMLGHNVAVLVDEMKQPGSYSVRWDASQLSSGIYLVALTSGGILETKKIILMK